MKKAAEGRPHGSLIEPGFESGHLQSARLQIQRMGQRLVGRRLLAGQCLGGFCAKNHANCDADRHAEDDAHGYVPHGRPQCGSETQPQTNGNTDPDASQ
jgi:hypothetical protein